MPRLEIVLFILMITTVIFRSRFALAFNFPLPSPLYAGHAGYFMEEQSLVVWVVFLKELLRTPVRKYREFRDSTKNSNFFFIFSKSPF